MSKKRLQVILSEDAWLAVEALTSEANAGFEVGTINYSDAINEMIITSKVDVKILQTKHTDIRRSLRAMASKENVDLDNVIKTLMELKSRSGVRKNGKTAAEVLSG